MTGLIKVQIKFNLIKKFQIWNSATFITAKKQLTVRYERIMCGNRNSCLSCVSFQLLFILEITWTESHQSNFGPDTQIHLLKRVLVPGDGAEREGKDDETSSSVFYPPRKWALPSYRWDFGFVFIPFTASQHLWVKVSIIICFLKDQIEKIFCQTYYTWHTCTQQPQK